MKILALALSVSLAWSLSGFADDDLTWVAETVPLEFDYVGPDIPPVGSSLFDKLFYKTQLYLKVL